MAGNNLLAIGLVAFMVLSVGLIVAASPSADDGAIYGDKNIRVFLSQNEEGYMLTFVNVSGDTEAVLDLLDDLGEYFENGVFGDVFVSDNPSERYFFTFADGEGNETYYSVNVDANGDLSIMRYLE